MTDIDPWTITNAALAAQEGSPSPGLKQLVAGLDTLRAGTGLPLR